MAILELTYAECKDSSAIRRAWKRKIRVSHPDKNMHGEDQSTRQTQRLNEAKEFLMDNFPGVVNEKRMQDYDAELKKRFKEMDEHMKFQVRLDEAHKRLMKEMADIMAQAPISIGRVATNLGYELRWMDSKAINLDLRKRYIKHHGKPPPKHDQLCDGRVTQVNSYNEQDRPLVEEALHAYFKPCENSDGEDTE